MRNRSLQVKMVKTEPDTNTDPQTSVITFQEKAAIVGSHLVNIVETVGKGVLMYVLVDTLRQVAIEKAKS